MRLPAVTTPGMDRREAFDHDGVWAGTVRTAEASSPAGTSTPATTRTSTSCPARRPSNPGPGGRERTRGRGRRLRADPARAHPSRRDRRRARPASRRSWSGSARARSSRTWTGPSLADAGSVADTRADGRTIRSLARPLVALLAIALVFRVQIIAIGPLLPSIQSGLASRTASPARSARSRCCAWGSSRRSRRRSPGGVGARWALAVCAALVIGFGLLRLARPGPVLVLALTFGVGLGMGLAGPIFPMVVRHEMPARPALGTGAYAIGLVLGATIAAAVAVPLAGDGGDWRFALAVITLAGLGSLAVWLGLAPPDEVGTRRSHRRASRGGVRSPGCSASCSGCSRCSTTAS